MTIRHALLSVTFGVCLSLAGACAKKPAPEQPSENPSAGSDSPSAECGDKAPSTPEHCECLGGYVKGDIGDGKVACTDGETELERVQQGIEGAVCCKAAASQ